MNKKRCFLSVAAIAIMLVSFTGCEFLVPLMALGNYKQDQSTIYVAFSKDGEENDPIDFKEIADYKSVYSDYNSRVMYNTLSPAEQQIYRLFEYAMDKEYTSMFFDSRLLADIELSLEDILGFYSIDSPMVQQNFSGTVNESGYTFSYLGKLLSFKIEGEAFYIENFSHEAMQKKKEAIKAAKKVFATMPKNLNQLEQARFFYRYLTREVKYNNNGIDPGKQHNLYDAFVLKKTQCDGFSNAFSLLCAMAKIPCVEKLARAKKEGEIGHTWNIFCADGVWYNAELALNEDQAKLQKKMNVDFSFGFSDDRATYTPDFADRLPKCTANLIELDYMASSASDSKLLSSIKSAFRKNGKHYVYIGLKKGELKTSDLQRIANYLNHDIYTLDQTYGGKNYYYIFKD